MISSKFTLLELTDLALRVPEVGAINFNILHTVLTRLIIEIGLDGLKPPCYIENEALAQVAITKARLERSLLKRLSKVPTVKEMKDRIKDLEDKTFLKEKSEIGEDSKQGQDVFIGKKDVSEEPEEMYVESAKDEEKVLDTTFEDSTEAVGKEEVSVEESAKAKKKVEDEPFEESAKAKIKVEDEPFEESAKAKKEVEDEPFEESETDGKKAEVKTIKDSEKSGDKVEDTSTKERKKPEENVDNAFIEESEEGKKRTEAKSIQDGVDADDQVADTSFEESEKADDQAEDTSIEDSDKGADQDDDTFIEEQEKDNGHVTDTSIEESEKADDQVEDTSIEESGKADDQVSDTSIEESKKTDDQVEDTSIEESKKADDQVEDTSIEESEKVDDQVEDTSIEESEKADDQVEDTSIEESGKVDAKFEDISYNETAAAEKEMEQMLTAETPKSSERIEALTTAESEVIEKKDASTDESAMVAEKIESTPSAEKAKDEEAKIQEDTVTRENMKTSEEISILDEKKIERIVGKLAEMTAGTPTDEEKLVEDVKDSKAPEMTIGEMQEKAQDLLEQSASIVVEKVAVVTDALKILEDEELLDSEPAKVMEELWRATNINRRMDAAEEGLRELSAIMDAMLDKVQDLEDASEDALNKTRAMISEISKFLRRIEILEETSSTLSSRIDDSNDQRAFEVERLEGIISELTKDHEETKAALLDMEAAHHDLAERVASKEDLEDLKSYMSEALDSKAKEIKKLIREVEDTLVKKEDFTDIVLRLDELEESKVSRSELGRLLEPGFIDSFLNEQENLRTDLEELKLTVSEFQDDFSALKTRIDEDIVNTMDNRFVEIHAMLDKINEKLALLDPDEINDSFANLEEQAAMIIQDLEELKASYEQFQKEARINFNKISNFNDLLSRLDQTKADKIKMYELLEMKADIDMLASKLDRREFVEVVGEMKENLERLTITVKINEEEMTMGFTNVRHDLSLKMYTEDFITATEPIRNRIKAQIYELERVKQIALTHLFPDAPGITKCISCKRGANLAGSKYIGDASVDLLQEVPPAPNTQRTSKPFSSTVSIQESSDVRLPPIDLDSVPIPPADYPRQKDASRLPLLFAKARPQIGLAHEMRRRDIDKKLAAYFASRPVRPCDGRYTRTAPQQRGLDFTTITLPQVEKEEVLLPGIDKGIYRGAVYGGRTEDSSAESQAAAPVSRQEDELAKKAPDIPSLKPPRAKKGFIKPDLRPRSKHSDGRNTVAPSVVSLHVDDEPLQKTTQLTKSTLDIILPSGSSKKDASYTTKTLIDRFRSLELIRTRLSMMV